jgi:hypothetical protein
MTTAAPREKGGGRTELEAEAEVAVNSAAHNSSQESGQAEAVGAKTFQPCPLPMTQLMNGSC